MAFQDLYELVDVQTIAGQEVLNVYYYINNNVLNGGATAEDLAEAFEAQVLPSILAVQVELLTHTELRVKNLYTPSDAHVLALSESGAIATDAFPTFDAVGFRLVQGNGAIRNGAKRIGGIPEGAATDGVIDSGTYITALDAVGTAMADTLSLLLADVFMPVVVGRILDGGSYRLPANSGEAVLGAILEAVFSVLVTSQTSRKIGVGE